MSADLTGPASRWPLHEREILQHEPEFFREHGAGVCGTGALAHAQLLAVSNSSCFCPPHTNTPSIPMEPTADYPEELDEEYEEVCPSSSSVDRARLEEAREALIALLDAESLKTCIRLLAVIKAGQEAEREAKLKAEQDGQAKAESPALETPKSQAGKRKAKGCPSKHGPRNQSKMPRGNRNLPTILEEGSFNRTEGSSPAQARI